MESSTGRDLSLYPGLDKDFLKQISRDYKYSSSKSKPSGMLFHDRLPFASLKKFDSKVTMFDETKNMQHQYTRDMYSYRLNKISSTSSIQPLNTSPSKMIRNNNTSVASLDRDSLVSAQEREIIPIPGTFLVSKWSTNELFEHGPNDVLR